MALILTPVVLLLGHVVVPQQLSLLSARHGWANGGPGWLNLLGLIPIGAGAAFSVAVLAGTVVIWGSVGMLVVPWEERNLEARFGEAYLRYKHSVPRWLGRRSR